MGDCTDFVQEEPLDLQRLTKISSICRGRRIHISKCLSHKWPASGCPYKFGSRRTTGSSMVDQDFGHLSRGRRINISGDSDIGILSNFGASSIFTWSVSCYCVGCLSIATRQSGDDIHDFSSCHLRRRQKPVPQIQRMSLNRLSQCHLGAHPSLCTFDISVPTPRP